MKKVYEIKGKDSCRVKVVYCGASVVVDFTNGAVIHGRNARYITDNKFVQDAIESDPRFGSLIICAEVYGAPEVKAKESAPIRNVKAVKSVKNTNDAIDWFASKGEVFTNKEELDALCEKYGVEFPNLK